MATTSFQKERAVPRERIPPHGGKLVARWLSGNAYLKALERSRNLKQVFISTFNVYDIEMIATGAFSPLTGFMNQADYESVLGKMQLADGTVWPIPITLSPKDVALISQIREGEEIALVQDTCVVAIMTVTEKFKYDKKREAKLVYQTLSDKHPGVERLFRDQGDVALAGEIQCVNRPKPTNSFLKHWLTPAETRQRFAEKQWRAVVGFQTRNPLHVMHERLMKWALELVDGLLLHPLIGDTCRDDISAEIRMATYELLLNSYFRPERVVLGVFPAFMRYAGPREALFHALCRKNYGCTHFIVGRDHAGIGNFYKQKDYEILQDFQPHVIGIEILKYEPTLFCRECDDVVTSKTCPHEGASSSSSGTEIRRMLRAGMQPPESIMRPEISKFLLEKLNYEGKDSTKVSSCAGTRITRRQG